MVKINGIVFKGNDLLIDNTGTYIDGVEISKCKLYESDKKVMRYPWSIFCSCIILSVVIAFILYG
jgi:hypothetical protein